jgi:hypothetical protein
MKLKKKTIVPALTAVLLVLIGAIEWALNWPPHPPHYWVIPVISGVLMAVVLLKRIRAERDSGEKTRRARLDG